MDFLKVMNEHPYRANVDIASPADWRRLRPAPLSSDFYQEQLDEVKMILDEIQDDALVLVTIFGPFRSGNNTSDDKVTDHMKADPLAVSQGLEAIADSLAEFAVALVDAGAAGIYYSTQGGEQDRFTEYEFLQLHQAARPDRAQRQSRTRASFNLLHICKDYIRLPLYVDYPGHAVNWAATKHNLSLVEGRTLFKRTDLRRHGRPGHHGRRLEGGDPGCGEGGDRELRHGGLHPGRRLHAAHGYRRASYPARWKRRICRRITPSGKLELPGRLHCPPGRSVAQQPLAHADAFFHGVAVGLVEAFHLLVVLQDLQVDFHTPQR